MAAPGGIMRIPALLFALAFISIATVAQDSGQKSCVILKRMGPADEITSHLYSFGIRGKQFQFVEGDFPKGMKFHGRLTDHDVREIMDKGGKVSVVEKDYKREDLQDARKSCTDQVAQSLAEKSANEKH
jgi:hypothetical protein